MRKNRRSSAVAKPNYVSDEQAGLSFLRDLYRPTLEGLIEIRALKPVGGTHARNWFSDVEEAYEFAASFNEHRNVNVYFGVAKRRGRSGDKASVLGTSALWFDLDCVNAGWNTEKCLEHICVELNELCPSAIVRSGGGLHGYYYLTEPLTDVAFIESCNATLRDIFSADKVFNADRILRVPDTWNVKRSRLCEVQFSANHRRFNVTDLMKALKRHGPLFPEADFPRQSIGRRASAPVTFGQYNKEPLDDLWGRRVKYHAPGQGTIGVNEAIMLTTARLHSHGLRDEPVLDATLRRVKQVHAAQAPNEIWDWEEERAQIRSALERWKVKWSEIKATKRRPA